MPLLESLFRVSHGRILKAFMISGKSYKMELVKQEFLIET